MTRNTILSLILITLAACDTEPPMEAPFMWPCDGGILDCHPVRIAQPDPLVGDVVWEADAEQGGATNPPIFDGRYVEDGRTVDASFIVHPRGGAAGPYTVVFALPTEAEPGTFRVYDLTLRGHDPLSYDGAPCVSVTEQGGVVVVTDHRRENAGMFTGGPTIGARIHYTSR